MATITHGPVTVLIPDHLALSDKAGNLTPDEILRLPKAPGGIGLAADLTATAMSAAGSAFTAPQGITPASLEAAAARADGYDSILGALEVLTRRVQQANLLADAECWHQLREVNDLLKGQVKHHPELAAMFAPLTAFMKRGPRGGDAAAPAEPAAQ